mgnify:CR=1 FL=1
MLAVTHPALPLDAMFHRLFEASPDPTVVAEFGTGRMLMLNPQFERLIGCEPGELDGLTVPAVSVRDVNFAKEIGPP